MTDWATIASLATAGGTLVLAVATFSAVRSANRTAQAAELSLLTGLRPVLIPSREQDPDERVSFVDGRRFTLAGHGAILEHVDGNIYLGLGVRNAGAGLAVLHGWRVTAYAPGPRDMPPLEDFNRQSRDIYIPAGDSGYWHAAIRDPADPRHAMLAQAAAAGEGIIVDLLYGDHEGGQRTIARFGVTVAEDRDERWVNVVRYWNVDRADPR